MSVGRAEWLLLGLIGLLYLGLGTAYSLATPVGEGPDEPGHIAYVRYLADERRLPMHGTVAPPLARQVKHPPLYYALGALAVGRADLDSLLFWPNPHFYFDLEGVRSPAAYRHTAAEDPPYRAPYRALRWLRGLSLLLGLGVIGATWALGRELWPARPEIRLGAAALLAAWPQWLFLQGVINNDALALPLAALTLLAAARVLVRGAARRDLLLLGVAVGLGLMAKLTTLPMAAVGGLAVLGAAWRARGAADDQAAHAESDDPAAPARDALHEDGGDDAVSGDGHDGSGSDSHSHSPSQDDTSGESTAPDDGSRDAIRHDAPSRRPSTHLADGPLTVLRRALVWTAGPVVLLAGWWFARNWLRYGGPLGMDELRQASADGLRTVPLTAELEPFLTLQFTSFWGRFGWMTVPLPQEAYHALGGLLVLAAVGGLVLLWRARRWPADARWGLALLGAAVGLTYLAALRLGLTFDLIAAQGRYLFPALPAVALLLVLSLTALVPRRLRALVAVGLAVGMLGLAVIGLTEALGPAFRPPPVLAADERPDDPLAVDFGPSLRLLGYELSAERFAPGATLDVTLDWTALGQAADGYVVFLHLIDSTGRVVGQTDVVPYGGRYPTLSWRPGRPFRDHYTVEVAPDATPGRAELHIGMYQEWTPDERLPVTVGGAAAGQVFRVAPLVIERPPPPPPEVERADIIEPPTGRVRLDGYTLQRADDGLAVTLHWTALEVPLPDDTVLVHLVGPDGRPVTQADGPPDGGRYPPSLWQPGETVPDRHLLPLPADPQHARYRLLVGWYDPAGVGRRTARDADGQRWPDDRIELTALEAGELGGE